MTLGLSQSLRKGRPFVELSYQNKEPEFRIIANTPHASFREIRTFGGYSGNGWIDNLILGDNLPVLKTLYLDKRVMGRVKLVYIDPPFGTGRTFDGNDDLTRIDRKVYDDVLVGPEYLEFLRRRLVFLRELLSEDGSIYVHLDQKIAHYVKVMMDEIFGPRNFRNWIARKKCHPKGYTKKKYGNVQDYILFYTKSDDYVWNRPLDALTSRTIKSSEYRYVEETTGRVYKKVPLHAPGIRNGNTGKPWRGKPPPEGKHWQYTTDRLEEFDKKGKVYWSPTGNPRLKIYLNERQGVLAQDIWLEFLDPMNQFTSVTGYPTEKNQLMLERIVKTSSNQGDVVLDCFMGSGTTAAAASSLGRKWIGVDSSQVAIETTTKRMVSVSETHKLVVQPFRLYEAIS